MTDNDKHFSLPVEIYNLPSLIAYINFNFVESIVAAEGSWWLLDIWSLSLSSRL